MAVTYNVIIPPTILRLGICKAEELILIGLQSSITRMDIDDLVTQRYPKRKRAANFLTREVTEDDLDDLNRQLLILRNDGINFDTRMELISSYCRGICTIRVLA